jgi:hypothetical protein
MNEYQRTFLLTFFAVFALLFGGSIVTFQKLRAAGYDPANLILYGLERKPLPTAGATANHSSMAEVAGVNVTQFLQDYPQVAALAAGLLGALVFFFGFGSKRIVVSLKTPLCEM